MNITLGDMSLSSRIYLLATMGIALLLLVGGLGLYQQIKNVADMRLIYEERTEPLVQLAYVQQLLSDNTKRS